MTTYLKDLKFRDWLVENLSRTGHARARLEDEEFESFAENLGVHPDVLAEARALLKMRLMQAGRKPPLGTTIAGSSVYRLKIKTPEKVLAAWKEECAARGCDRTTLFRSVIHAYLQGSAEPASLGAHWTFEGERLPVRRGEETTLEASITPAAVQCLQLRALALGISATAIGRGLVLEVLAGRYLDVPMVEPRRMFNDLERYNTGSSVDS